MFGEVRQHLPKGQLVRYKACHFALVLLQDFQGLRNVAIERM